MGTSESYDEAMEHVQDHPHAYGDKAQRNPKLCVAEGSSPRVWGQAKIRAIMEAQNRIIPMRVGTRLRIKRLVFQSPYHPHACGDKTLSMSIMRQVLGSSPCVWGQDLKAVSLTLLGRIIPMRVGTRR